MKEERIISIIGNGADKKGAVIQFFGETADGYKLCNRQYMQAFDLAMLKGQIEVYLEAIGFNKNDEQSQNV